MNFSLLQLTRNHIPHLEHRSSMYVAFLDTQRAFDTVWRHVFVVKLHQLGVTGSLWTLIDDCHTNSFCFAVVNQINSDWFPVSQGVRQGRILSIFLYLVYINVLLQDLEKASLDVGIFSVNSSNPILADDIA